MFISGMEGVKPIQKNTARRVSAGGVRRTERQGSRYDRYSLSKTQEESASFRELTARLSQQVRTTNTTGKIQDLRREVQSGRYQVDPRETAARMLLIEEDA